MHSRENEVHELSRGVSLIIIRYFKGRCSVMFNDGHVRHNVGYGDILRKEVKNYYHPTVKGVGYLGEANDPLKTRTKNSKARRVWYSMFNRCYSGKYRTYEEMSVCEEWHNFQNFAKWFEENYNPKTMEKWELDKDVLIKGNKVYSPETCCFIPHEINKLILRSRSDKGLYPRGVWKLQSKFISEIIIDDKKKRLGTFSTYEEAFLEYKKAKEANIKDVANRWRSVIPKAAYDSLCTYEVTRE